MNKSLLLITTLKYKNEIDIKVTGDSMFPSLKNEQKVTIEKKEKYKIGDIVVFKNDIENHIIIHRIIWKCGSRYITKGDNNYLIDSVKIKKNNILGAVKENKKNFYKKALLIKACILSLIGSNKSKKLFRMQKCNKKCFSKKNKCETIKNKYSKIFKNLFSEF